jgi:hypothetical protein
MLIKRHRYDYDIFVGKGWDNWTRVHKYRDANRKEYFKHVSGQPFNDKLRTEFFNIINSGIVQ